MKYLFLINIKYWLFKAVIEYLIKFCILAGFHINPNGRWEPHWLYLS